MNSSALRLSLLASALAVSLSAQSEPVVALPLPSEASAPAEAAGTAATEGNPNARQQRQRRGGNENGSGNRNNFNPADIQARMMESMREQFAVKDDAEWTIIAERITAINDLRRGQFAGAIGMFTGGMGGARAAGGNRFGGMPANPEQDALRSAVTDNLPDAEITARLAKLREARKQSEAKLDQARDNLRAVLTLRQEAVAVMMGLLN